MRKKVSCIYSTADLSEILAEPSCMEGGLCTAGFIKKEPPRVRNYANVCLISSLLKPKGIQYSVYSTGKLHKDPFLNTCMVYPSFRC